MPRPPIRLVQTVRATHAIITGYGHWLPNDPRGSRSDAVRADELKPLGEPHVGRKRVQPPRDELRGFYRKAEPLLLHDTNWFDQQLRGAIADGVRSIVKERGYTLWSYAVLRNHHHLVVRTHRDRVDEVMHRVSRETQKILWDRKLVPKNHPVWADCPWKVFLRTPQDIRTRINYVKDNPMKEGLPPQTWDFVVPYNG